MGMFLPIIPAFYQQPHNMITVASSINALLS